MRQRSTVICLEGWYYLVVMAFILAGAMLREINLLVVLFGMMVGPLLFNWRSVVVTLRGLEFKRHAPEGARAGNLLVVDVEVTNTRRWWASWALIVEDRIRRLNHPRPGTAITGSVFFPYVPVKGTRKAAYQGVLTQRGRYRFGPLRVTTRFPLGLVRRTVVVESSYTITVFPRLGRLTPGWMRRQGEAARGSRRATQRQGLLEGDYHGLRDFRSGDSKRWIHWRTTARRGQVMVREFEQQRNQDLCLLLDLWQPAEPKFNDLENVELAVSFAATVFTDRCRRGGSFLMIGTAATDVAVSHGPASNALLEDAMESLAVAEANSIDRLPELLSKSLEAVRAGTSIVLISTRPVDLSAAQRFAEIWSDPRKSAWAGSILVIDTSSPQLAHYFEPE